MFAAALLLAVGSSSAAAVDMYGDRIPAPVRLISLDGTGWTVRNVSHHPASIPSIHGRSDCEWRNDTDYDPEAGTGSLGASDATSKEQCCADCWLNPQCAAAVFSGAKAHGRCTKPPGHTCCWLKTKRQVSTPVHTAGVISCIPRPNLTLGGPKPRMLALPPGQAVRAAVPGTVVGALFAAGVRPDPQFGRNQLDVFESSTTDTFTYSRTFASPEGGCGVAGRRCELIFDGIDTAANISVNGQPAGRANNMHMRWVWDVGSLLHPASDPPRQDNTVDVEIEPATAYAQRQAALQGDPSCKKHARNYWPEKWGHETECSGYVRKNTGSFGWDCAPAYVTAGIWKSVWLRVFDGAAIDVVAPQIAGTIHAADDPERSNSFEVQVRVFLDVVAAGEATLVVAGSWSLGARASKKVLLQPTNASGASEVVLVLSAKNVALWWPNGHGLSTQTLYNLTTTLTLSDGSSSSVVQRIGFRTFEFVGSVGNNTERWGSGNASLWFKVNGSPMYAKGNNWMPSSVLTADDAHYQELTVARLKDEVAVGGNTIRVWGGGIYETETFYRTADELGLVILQDGSFFGSYPGPDDVGFTSLVGDEIEFQARRLASHVSLCLYSGNNESPDFANIPLFIGTQLATMQRENTNVALLPSCPSDGWATLHPLTPRNGYQWTPGVCATADGGADTCPHDNHYYGPCGTIPANTKTGGDRGRAANFGSEFGWPSADIMSVTKTITPAGEGLLQFKKGGKQGSSPFLDYRSQIKNPDWTVESMLYANSTMTAAFPTMLGTQDDGTSAGLERWLYLTQALQTKCVGGSIENYRQHSEVMGSLNWAINSIWLGPAWGSISHDGHWKMLHYRLRHVFKPLLLSFIQPSDTSEKALKAGAALNAGCPDNMTCPHLSSHLPSAVSRTCNLHVRSFATGESLHQEAFTAVVPAGPAGAIAKMFKTVDLFDKAGAGCSVAAACWLTADCAAPQARFEQEEVDVEEAEDFPTPLAQSLLLPVNVSLTRLTMAAGGSSLSFDASVNTTAPYTFFSCELNGVFSDNSLTLRPGKPLTLTFTPTSSEAIPSVAAFRQATRIYTINNKSPQLL